MSMKVLKSLFGVGQVSSNEQYLFYPARPSVIGDTPNARCVLQSCRTDNPENVGYQCKPCRAPVRHHIIVRGVESYQQMHSTCRT